MSPLSQKRSRGEVQRVQRPDRTGERLERTSKDPWMQLDEGDTCKQEAGQVSMGASQVSGVEPDPQLVLQ